MFDLRGLFLALFPLARLAHDGSTEPAPDSGGIRSTIGITVDTTWADLPDNPVVVAARRAARA